MSAYEDGAIVLYGRCDEDLGIPYQPVAEALHHLVEHVPNDLLQALGDRNTELARLVPVLRERVGAVPLENSDPDTARYALLQQVVQLVASASTAAPVVLLLDDIHWADKPTITMLKHLVVSSHDFPLLVIATYRSEHVTPEEPLARFVASMHAEQGTELIALRGLDANEIVEFVAKSGFAISAVRATPFAELLYREAGGNPFFTVELVRHLAERGAIDLDGARAPGAEQLPLMELPQSVRDVVLQRVSRLGGRTLEMLSAAAVIGHDFELDVLAASVNADDNELIDILDRSERAALVATTDGRAGHFAFAHGLIVQTLYENLGATRRRACIAMSRSRSRNAHPTRSQRSHLIGRAGSRSTADRAKAIRYAQLAADRALGQLAPDEAVRWYGQVLSLLDQSKTTDSELRCDALIGLGTAKRQSGDRTYIDPLLEAAALAKRRGDTDRLTRAALETDLGSRNPLDDVTATRLGVINDALAASEHDSPVRAQLLALYARERAPGADWEEAEQLAIQAVGMARRQGNTSALIRTLVQGADTAHSFPETLDRRFAYASEALELARTDGDRHMECRSNLFLAWARYELGDFATADRDLEAASALADELAFSYYQMGIGHMRVFRMLGSGNLTGAEAEADLVRERAERADYPGIYAIWGAQLLAIRRCQGRLGEMLELFTAIAETADHPGIGAALALIHCEVDQPERAAPLLAAAGSKGFADVPHDQSRLSVLNAWATIGADLGDTTHAEPLYELLAPWHRRVVLIGTCTGSVAYYLGLLATLLGRYGEAEQHFATAQDVAHRVEAPFWYAQAHLGMARMLIARAPLTATPMLSAHVANSTPPSTLRTHTDLRHSRLARPA